MPTKTPVKSEETEVIDILEPEAAEYTLVLEGEGETITIVQKPLSFMGKMKLFSVLSSILREVMANDVSISDLIDAPQNDSLPLSGDRSSEADTFLRTLLAVAEYAPERLPDLLCVILAVPAGQVDYMKERLDADLTDEQAEAVINTFIDQNWEVLYNFFTVTGPSLFKKISGKFQK